MFCMIYASTWYLHLALGPVLKFRFRTGYNRNVRRNFNLINIA